MGVRIAITGASGNVGTALLSALAGSGHELRGLARRPPVTGRHRGDERAVPAYRQVAWFSADLSRPDSEPVLTELLDGCDAVVHLAWAIQPGHDRELLRRTNVEGTRRVLAAARRCGVTHLVQASSVGTYAPGPSPTARVDETWPTTGIQTSAYAQDKAAVEALLDEAQAAAPELLISRLRPALIFQRPSASEIARYFLGPLVPAQLLGRLRTPLLPLPRGLRLQVVHAADVADAYVRVLQQRAGGAFNVGAEPVLSTAQLAALLGAARFLELPPSPVRGLVGASWHARLQPVDPGWFDLAMGVPLLDTSRARRELGWRPARSAPETIQELLAGLAGSAGTDSPVLRGRGLLTGRGGR